MARLTLNDHNHNKVLFRLAHHPDCKGATHEYDDASESLIVTAPNGARIRVKDDIDWLRGEDDMTLDGDLIRGAVGLLSCLVQAHQTLDTEEELEDLVCELYRSKTLEGDPRSLLKEAFMYMGMGLDNEIGYRSLRGRVVPDELRRKCNGQLSHFLEKEKEKGKGDWNWGSLYWIPLKELVMGVCTDPYIDAQWKHSNVQCAKATLFDHYQRHEKLANRYAVELQRRVSALEDDGVWPVLVVQA